MKATMGDFSVMDAGQFSAERFDDPEYEVPKVILVWGQNPPPTCSDGFFGHWVVDCMKRGSKIISIDPRNTWMSTRAEHHLQIRPGTDGALALGMLN
ncbi:MAG: molybdopterin-dependent oxidoreductase, partial [Deltaproteobacteria bacterium]|nr:molybdopterin-dependent oxidoreductase [Deltaproteobacteria bacterium]